MNNPPPPSQSLEEHSRRRAASSTTYQEHSASSTNDDGHHHYPLQYPPPPPGRYDHYRDVRQVAPVVSSPGGLHTSSPPHLPPLSNSHHHPQYNHLLATAESASDSSSGDGGSPDHHRGLTHHHPSFNYGVSGCSSRDGRDIINSVASWPLPPAPAMSFDLSSPSLTSAVERMAVTGTSSSPSSSPSSPPAIASSSSGPLKKRRKISENEQMDESNNNNVARVNTSEECCDRRDEKNNAEDQHDAITVTTYADQEAILMRDHSITTTFQSHHHHRRETSFPIILHELLSMQHEDSSYILSSYLNDDGNRIVRVEEAMEWLPHGKGFRILRYEELVQNILPKAFPTLCDCGRNDDKTTPMTDGDKKTAIMEEQRGEIVVTMDERGNINVNKQQEQQSKYFSDNVWVDSFLWHMKAWGFQEITMGVDRGSFFHEMFIKESPNLCKSMRMIPQQPTLRTPSPLEMPVTPISSSLSRNAKTPVSSIYKPPRLSIPMLRDTNSYEANNLRVGNNGRYQQQQHQQYQQQYPQQHFQYPHQQQQQQQQQYYQQHHFPLSYPQPPPTFRSPRTIRFIDEQHQELVSSSSSSSSAAITSDSVEVTPNLERNQNERKKLSSPATGCTVSKRGRRPTVISRHASH